MAGRAVKARIFKRAGPRNMVCGHALVTALVASLLLALTAASAAHWWIQLLQAERLQAQRIAAMRMLHNAMELSGQASPVSIQAPQGTGISFSALEQAAASQRGPSRGSFIVLSARWTDPLGQTHRLALATFAGPVARLH